MVEEEEKEEALKVCSKLHVALFLSHTLPLSPRPALSIALTALFSLPPTPSASASASASLNTCVSRAFERFSFEDCYG